MFGMVMPAMWMINNKVLIETHASAGKVAQASSGHLVKTREALVAGRTHEGARTVAISR